MSYETQNVYNNTDSAYKLNILILTLKTGIIQWNNKW